MQRWRAISGDEAASLEKQLQRELQKEHVLHGCVVHAVARRDDGDDVAFQADDGGLYVVHLTWSTGTDPAWPHTVRVDSLANLESDDG